ncbi:MAG: PEGA domain-containing protein [Proteobacteria bacterium]|nr:PEGA domain-containing protein [Pseudomonadota bacterium]
MERRDRKLILFGISMVLLGLFLGRRVYAEGEGEPAWLQSLPPSDAFYRYYVGRGESSKNEQDAFSEAYLNAQEQALKENFGVEAQIRNQSFETEKEGILTKSISERSQRVRLKGFEQVEFFRKLEEGSTQVWILFRYKNSEIEKERKRLSKKQSDEPIVFHEEGIDNSAKGGLKIVTYPSGANIFIDGTMVPFQKTPYTMYGQLEPGPHEIRLDHPNYEIAKRTVVFEVGRVTHLEVQLQKAFGTLKLTSNPSGAKISLNGKVIGRTPREEIKIRVGEPTYVEVSHPEAERMAKEISVVRGQVTEEHFEMTPKPAFFQVSSSPEGAAVVLRGQKIYRGTTPTDLISCEAGEYSLEISKPGFDTKTQAITIRGGERKVLPTFSLEKEIPKDQPVPAPEISKPNQSGPANHPYQSAVFGLSFIGMASTFDKLDQPGYGGSVSLEVKLAPHVGLFAEGIYKVSGTVKYKNGEVSNSSSGYRVGLPIYGNAEKGSVFFISPEVIGLSTSLKLDKGSYGTQDISASQTGYGVSIGVLGLDQNTKNGQFYRLSVHGFGDGGGYKGSTAVSFGLGVIFGQ